MGVRIIAEVAFGYTITSANPAWTDITQYVDLAEGISINNRGAADELSQTQPATMSLTLDNSDGRFTSPNVKKNVPIRLRVVSADRNLVTNPGFETDVSDWSSSGTPTFARSTAQAKVGTASMLVTWGAVSSQSVRANIYGLDVGTTYTANAFVRVPAGDAAVRLKVAHPVTGSDLASGSLSTLNDTWQRITVTWTATETSAQLRVSPNGTPTAGDQVYVDAVVFEEGSAASALNHLANGDFESSVANWASSGTPAVARSTTRAQRGTASMLVTWGGVDNQSVTSDAMTTTVGQAYVFSAYVWVPSGHTPVRLTVAGGNLGNPSTLFDQWERITVTWTASATSHQVRIRHNVIPTNGHQVWMDAAQVEEGSTPAAYSPLDGAQIHARYFGMVNEWPLEWKGLQGKTTITCTDIFKWARLESALQPMLNQEILLDRPTAYYPLGEAADSTSAGDISGTAGVGALSIVQAGSGGTLTFSEGTGPSDGLGCPKFTPASSTAGKYLSADLGTTFFDANVGFRIRAECWFSTATSGRVLWAVTSTDNSIKLVVSLESGTGKLMIEFAQDGMALQSYVAATPNLADDALHYVIFHEFADEVYVDGVTYSTVTTSAGDFRQLYVGGFANSRLWSGQIAQLALYVRSITTGEISPHYTTGTTEHVGETADARLARIASYVGLTVTTQGTVFDPMASQKALGRSALEHMREIETTESGKLLASRSSAALLFQSRSLRYNPTPAVSIAYADLETDGVQYPDDDQKMINSVTATRASGATQRIISQTSIDTYGPKPRELELFKTTDLKVTDAANWLVSRYADPPPEVRQVPVEAYSMPLTTYRALLNADVSTVLGLTGLPDQAPASTATLVVEGYSEHIGLGTHLIDFHTSRADSDNVWVLDDTTYSVLDSTTRLAY